jgi:hypothetical protein
MVRDVALGVALGSVLGSVRGDELGVALGEGSTMPTGAAAAGAPDACVLARRDRAMTMAVNGVITAMTRRLLRVVTT